VAVAPFTEGWLRKNPSETIGFIAYIGVFKVFPNDLGMADETAIVNQYKMDGVVFLMRNPLVLLVPGDKTFWPGHPKKRENLTL
jgi:hypothetical protein